MTISRRRFIGQTSSLAAFGTLGVPTILGGASIAQEDQATLADGTDLPEVRVGIVGLNGRGVSLMNQFRQLPGVRVVALCDVDSNVLNTRAADMQKAGFDVQTFNDFRQMLDGDTIDAAVIATPNHWHALMAVWACDAGKDVYVEKPVSHVVAEGRSIVDAAERNGRIVQSGMHGRSHAAVQSAIAFAQSGALGEVVCARGLCYKPRRSIGKVNGPQFVPPTIDYHRWLGPAPYTPLSRRSLHYDWHWDSATGNGDLGNQGVHQMDIARWGAGHDRLPDRAWSTGGRVGYDDDGNTPNTQVTVLEYDNGPPVIFEVRGLPCNKKQQSDKWEMDRYHDMDIGVVFHCEDGEIRVSKNYNVASALDKNGQLVQEWKGGGNHAANFIEAVRAGDPSLLTAPIIDGHLSAACGHLGLVSCDLGEDGSIDDAYEAARSDLAREAVARMREHMLANRIAPETDIRIGRMIPLDSNLERSTDPYANALFTKEYRAPFTMPGSST